MAGFIQDPIQFINLIADNLRDRYQSGFPVLKELIQNTDDSVAAELHFGRSPGLPGAGHVLLRGPALFFINNGRFLPSDAVGIRFFGQNIKAADEASIGKFGLGMKSVFHFCEAFFFLAHDGERPYAEVLNPWSDSNSEHSLHADWDEFSDSDARAIREHLAAVIGNSGSDPERLFILWLPLRRRQHLDLPDAGHAGAIVAEYPGDDPALLGFLEEETLPIRLAALMPMLRHLERVVFWELRDEHGTEKPGFEVRLEHGAKRLSLLTPDQETPGETRDTQSPHTIRGRIRVDRNSTNLSLDFRGLEGCGWNEALSTIHEHELWPISNIRDARGHSRQVKEKAQPHGTVIFSRYPGSGRLITNWSVFLPLDEEKAVETIPHESDQDFRVTMHGYFFVDAGRTKVHGLEDCDGQVLDEFDSEDSIRRAWNCELLRSTVLPLLLPALDAFCSDQKLAEKAKTALTGALTSASVVKRWRGSITEHHSWLREIAPDGVAWMLRSADRPVLRLPNPPDKEPSRPWRLFPALHRIAESFFLASADAPNLVKPSVDAQWQEKQLVQLLESVEVGELFAEATLLDYLASFLAEAAGPYHKVLSVRRVLSSLVRQGLLANGEEGLRRNESRVRNIVDHLDTSACFRIGNDLPQSLLRGLLSAETEVLPLPARFYLPERTGDAVLGVPDASLLLKQVENVLVGAADVDTALQNAALKVSEQLIQGVPAQDRPELLRRCEDLRILGGFDCKVNQRIPVSVREIGQAAEAGTLFGSGEARALQGFAVELRRILPQERVLVINRETASLALRGESAIAQCDGHAVLRTLGMRPRTLGGREERAALVELAHVPSGEQEIRGLRFLLHAKPEHFHKNDTLWVLGRGQAPVWKKLWTQLVGETDKPWNLLDDPIVDALARREWDVLDIQEIGAQAVLDEIAKLGISSLNSSTFDRDECEQILMEVRDSDDSLWCSLPFHWSSKGVPVSGAKECTFVDLDGAHLPEAMLHGVHLIPLSDNDEQARRQSRVLKPLDEQAAIRIALDHTSAPEWWRVIMDALGALDRKGKVPSPELETTIRQGKWLPTTDGDVVKPEDVIDLEAAEEEIDRILAREPGAFVTPRALLPAIAEHPFFPKLRETLFARGKKGLGQLAAALEALDSYQIGDVQFRNAEALADAAQVLGQYPNAGWQLLSALIERMGAENCFEALLSGMTGAIGTDSLVTLLNWITERDGDDGRVVRVFNQHLAALARENDLSGVLGRLTLLNQKSRWKPSKDLVSGVTGVEAGHVLHEDQARILAGAIYQDRRDADVTDPIDPVVYASETASAGPILRHYFDPWQGRVADPLVAVFVQLFGGDDSVKELCQDLLGQHSRDWLMSEVPWRSPCSGDATLKRDWLQGFTFEQALDHFRMAVRVHEGETLGLRSILGAPVNVSLDEQFTNLFLGQPSYFRLRHVNGYRVELVLRRIAPADCSDSQLSGYLRSSAEYLLHKVFNQNRPDLEALWGQLGQSDQVDIELAKALILDNIPFYLKQLGTHRHPSLRAGLDRFRKYERQEKEFGDRVQAEDCRLKKEQALQSLQHLIENNEEAQQAILESVRRKIMDFQYQPESVPFELFQNADDAVRNLEFIAAYPATPGDPEVDDLPACVRQFIIEADKNRVSFMHWGRAINQFGSQGFPGRERGFDRDLENMLILSASDKGEDMTGKFGLGFKSVWLVSDRPTIVSGRLQAVIVGGLLPVANHEEVTQGLVSRLAVLQSDRRWPGTAVQLPLLPEASEEGLLERFCTVAGVLVAFSRSLRTVEVRRSDQSHFSASWEPRMLPGFDSIHTGRIRQGDGDPLLVMKIQLSDGALLLAIGPAGFVELPEEIPHLWITAPIREQERLGFALNAMFEVDAGRSRLSAEVERNQSLARKLGTQLAAELDGLRVAVAGRWLEIAGAMEFGPGVDPYRFWYSLWHTLVSRLPHLDRESGSGIMATALLTEGLGVLSEAHEVVPNGLSGGLQRLIRCTEARTVINGALADSTILDAAIRASCFRTLLEVESAVSSDVATWLRRLVPAVAQRGDRLQSITLTHLISQLDRRRELAPEDAKVLGETLCPRTMEERETAENAANSAIFRDLNAAAGKAGDLSFLSADGSVLRCKQLLTDQGSEDEKRRWDFAPNHARLAVEYGAEGAAFFIWCRDRLEAPVDKLKEWVVDAVDDDRREAALRYLVEGDLARQVMEALHETGFAGSWLAAVDEQSDLLSNWEPDTRWRLVYQILKTPEETRNAFQYAGFHRGESPPEPIDAVSALERISKWWEAEREERMVQYLSKTYPEGRAPELSEDDDGNIDRSSWLLILLLGGFHTMGRATPDQHRTFIEDCQTRGWWSVFTDPNPAVRFEEWMGVLDEYVDRQVDQQQYEQWMMRFPIIYKMARYLDEYAELLLGLGKYNDTFDLEIVLRPWGDPDQQGGGIGAAALPKTLGTGANFVIRELIRLGAVDSPHLRAHAFVPYRRVRRLFAEMGRPEVESVEPRLRASSVISKFLHEHMDAEKAAFFKEFDIPFRIVANDWGLQQELLGRPLNFDDSGWDG